MQSYFDPTRRHMKKTMQLQFKAVPSNLGSSISVLNLILTQQPICFDTMAQAYHCKLFQPCPFFALCCLCYVQIAQCSFTTITQHLYCPCFSLQLENIICLIMCSNAFHYMHCILSVVFDALYSMNFICALHCIL